MKNVLNILVCLAIIVSSFAISSKNRYANDSEMFLDTLIGAYSVVNDDVEADFNQNSDYYRKAMQSFANLFLEIPAHYNSLDDLEEDLRSLGFVFCYRGSAGNEAWPDYLLVHFNCPIPVFGTIEANWNYLYLLSEDTIQCVPLYTQSNVALNGLQVFEKSNKLIFQLEGRVTNYHPLQLFVGFLTITEQGMVTPIQIMAKTKGGVMNNSEEEIDIPITISADSELGGNIYIRDRGLEIWLYKGLTAQIDSDGNIEIASNEFASEKKVSGLTIASLDFSSDRVIVDVNDSFQD